MRKGGVCKVGCGKETESKKCDTQDFHHASHDSVDRDHRGITKMFHQGRWVNQTPGFALKAGVATCDIHQVLLYKE
jgi:hypothetical protein